MKIAVTGASGYLGSNFIKIYGKARCSGAASRDPGGSDALAQDPYEFIALSRGGVKEPDPYGESSRDMAVAASAETGEKADKVDSAAGETAAAGITDTDSTPTAGPADTDTANKQAEPGITHIQTDYSPESLRKALYGCDAVVHLAYAMATKENEAGGFESYISSMDATRNILSAARELGISNIIFASSRTVYPRYSDEPFKEDGTAAPQNHYAESKLMMEELCEEYNSKGACIKTLRFGQIIGAGMKVRGLFSVFMEKAAANEPLTLIGSDVRDYICVKDACAAIDAALRHPEASGVFNISMGIGTDNRAMAEAVIKATGSSSEVILKQPGPAQNQSCTNLAGEGNASNPAQMPDRKPDRMILDCTKAKKELGFACEYDTVYKIAADAIHV